MLLQKTMMTVEGVARRIYPDHDIWAASDIVVRRWIARELSPAARVQRFASEAAEAMHNLARLLREGPPPPVAVTTAAPPRGGRLLWFVAGAAIAGLAILGGAWLAGAAG